MGLRPAGRPVAQERLPCKFYGPCFCKEIWRDKVSGLMRIKRGCCLHAAAPNDSTAWRWTAPNDSTAWRWIHFRFSQFAASKLPKHETLVSDVFQLWLYAKWTCVLQILGQTWWVQHVQPQHVAYVLCLLTETASFQLTELHKLKPADVIKQFWRYEFFTGTIV